MPIKLSYLYLYFLTLRLWKSPILTVANHTIGPQNPQYDTRFVVRGACFEAHGPRSSVITPQ
jgi:hypothetical protein